jgi:protein Tex
MFDAVEPIARALEIPASGVRAVLRLLGEGATVPFIARYRKEATGDLDEVKILSIEEKNAYLVDLETRRDVILRSIAERGKLTPELEARIRAADTKARLEDLYLPFKPKRKTRAEIARQKGLGPLAERILAQPLDGDPSREAEAFVSPENGVEDAEAALKGARDVAAEVVSENADVRAMLRDLSLKHGTIVSAVAKRAPERSKFEQYYDFREAVAQIPSHRFLALQRGESEGVLKLSIDVDGKDMKVRIAKIVGLDRRSPFALQLVHAIADAYERLIEPSVATDVFSELKARSDRAAVEVFAENLRSLLLAAPLGELRTIGVDPGLRTGCKLAALDETGRFLENATIYLSQGEKAEAESERVLVAFVKKHKPRAIGVGNGTGGREALAFVKNALARAGLGEIIAIPVNEAGASVYSASEIAREEHPDLDVTVRGAISIARRLQDPLAELVKIDPKSIGVGQYQHDVNQPMLAKKLEEVVQICVNYVGVELNTASAPLLAHVAGIGPSLAKKIVKHRDSRGAFAARSRLLEVAGLGAKTFEQAAGFLRIRRGEHPLDRSAVHPERYGLVERMAKDLGVQLANLVGDPVLADRIAIDRYLGDGVGRPTLADILVELKKPGRDPRATFEPPKFRDDVNALEDLKIGMELEGVVTNVTAFGAFVDVGVHQDGLVHVSQLADRYVKDPHDVVKPGDKLKVRVLEVDLARKRISLSSRGLNVHSR